VQKEGCQGGQDFYLLIYLFIYLLLLLLFLKSHLGKMGVLKRMVKDAKDIGGPLNCLNTSLEMSSFLATLLFC
jgi:hypothetical protein